jgi:hypothetical protein
MKVGIGPVMTLVTQAYAFFVAPQLTIKTIG